MIYAFICRDAGDQTERRSALLLEHLRYIETVIDHIVVAGPCPPTAAGDTRQFQGSMMLYRAESMTEAKALFDGDPYARNGIWSSVDVMPFEAVAVAYVGGTTWDIVDGKFTKRARPEAPR